MGRDFRGLNERGKKDYPKFRKDQVKTHECEICRGIKTVKLYKIVKSSGKESKGYLCDSCANVVTTKSKVTITCIEKPKKLRISKKTVKDDEEEEFKKEDKDVGDSLLV